MREFILNSADMLDREALEALREGTAAGLLPCKTVRYNEKIKLMYYPDACEPLAEVLEDMTPAEVSEAAEGILQRVQALLQLPALSPENVVWDMESIYLDGDGGIWLLCLPAAVPADAMQDQIYARRLYALLEDMFEQTEGGEETVRQIRHQKEKAFGDWADLQEALRRHTPEEYEALVLRSVNTPRALTFRIDHDVFLIGSETGEADGLILGVEDIEPQHAEIGWNDICYYVKDLGSRAGTFVNDQKIVPGAEVPIGQGTVLRFADCTFTVE